VNRLVMWGSTWALALFGVLANPAANYAQCGGTERWAVKVGTDPGASNVDLTNRIPISLADLISLPEQHPPANDNTTRLDSETHVYVIRARLVKFKFETNDNDYHMVITDDTLNFTKGGSAPPSGHSFVAEIPDPNCIAGAQGMSSTQSLFMDGIRNARSELETQFPNIDTSGKFNDAGGIPVQIVGVGFFDFKHGQVGRAPNNIEIHPVVDITFNPPSGNFTLSASPAQLSITQGASGSSVITTTVSGGLNAAITLSLAGTPPSANATLSPTSIPAPGSGSSALSLTIDASTPAGNYNLNVSGSGGGVTQTVTVPLTVAPSTSLPSVAVTAPADGSTLSGAATVTGAPSSSGAVKLEIYIDGALKACNFAAASISYPWDTTAVANGSHTIMAKAYNLAGAAASSTTISVTVAN
jgi:Bacterial Ig domain